MKWLTRNLLRGATATVSLLLASLPVTAQTSLLRNGSFEGGKRYWFEADDKPLVTGDAQQGKCALQIDKGGIQSAAFLLVPNKPVTISFSARCLDGNATMGWQCTPSDRELAAREGLTWGMRGKHPTRIGPTWERYSFTFTPTSGQTGFWPRPTYMMQLGDCDKPFLLDAVTVAYDAGAGAYLPYKTVEVQVNTPDLPGYVGPSSNILPKGATVHLDGSAFNPTDAPQTVTLRWQLFDYEGRIAIGKPVEKTFAVAAGQTVRQTVPVKLAATGLILARVTAWVGGKEVDRSDLPLTTLPYPQKATRPDARERFGASFFNANTARKSAPLGFRWSRWFPHTKWQDHQPDGPDTFHWFDRELDQLEAMGMSTHLVLYGWPKWIMDEGKHPLPRDMRWAADDTRWQDLTPQCAWDRYIVAVANHYRGRSVVLELENEPEFDGWEKYLDEYTQFTIRTARLIRKTNPKARIMVNNVYGIPSGMNEHLLRKGGGKWIDIISWHDYHEGGLTGGVEIKRMRQRLDELGGKQIEIWFNEGWAFTNTSVDEPALALINHTAAESTNALVSSVAEMTVNGQAKTILFHTGYDDHGMSFWDCSGPGTMLWDYYNYPLPLVGAWNTLNYHLGLSKPVAWVRPVGASVCVFEDLRNRRGVCVAYADREAKSDVTLILPFTGAIVEDCMGNRKPLPGRTLTLARNGRPVFLYTTAKTPGATLARRLMPLDRKNVGFVSRSAGAGTSYSLPPVWEGLRAEATDGNPARASGKPIWRLDQVFPPDPTKAANYHPLQWRNNYWVAPKDDVGGQPKAEIHGGLRMEFRAATGEPRLERICSLTFIAPQAGSYELRGSAELKFWDGDNPARLSLLHKTSRSVKEIQSLPLERDRRIGLNDVRVTLGAGDELVLVPRIDGQFTGGDVTLRDLEFTTGGVASPTYHLPQAWEGTHKGGTDSGSVLLAGKPRWRLYQIWPDDPTVARNYVPLVWSGVEWISAKDGMGGQPTARIESGVLNLATRGSWTGQEGQRIAGVAFVAPKAGQYRFTGRASTRPREGGAATYRLGAFKKDTQRATREKVIEMPRTGESVALDLTVELALGQELVWVSLMPDWHNATNTRIEEFAVRALP